MKPLKSTLAATGVALAMTLAGCEAGGLSGHGFEGKYSVEPTPSYDAKLAVFEKNDMTASVAQQIRANLASIDAEIGSDYAMFNGKRVEAERIFVREQEGKSYLVAVTESGEDVFPILDAEEKTLQVDSETMLVWEGEL